MVKILKYLAIGVITVIIFIFLLLKWMFWAPSDIQRNSLIYYLKVPKHVKEFPLWGTVNTPLYDVRYADGEKKSITVIDYTSSLNQQDLLKIARNLAFRCRQQAKEKMVCEKKTEIGQSIEMDFVKPNEANYFRITVVFIGY